MNERIRFVGQKYKQTIIHSARKGSVRCTHSHTCTLAQSSGGNQIICVKALEACMSSVLLPVRGWEVVTDHTSSGNNRKHWTR